MVLDHALPALVVVASWWLATGVVLKLVWLRRSTFRLTVGAFSVLAVGALAGLWSSSRETSIGAVYLSFGSALVVWAWHEITFLLGVITGPRKAPCPPGVEGWTRFRLATSTVIHHELALLGTMLALVALTYDAPNRVGTWTFMVLFVMRISAKLNVFLGVRNLSVDFVPAHLRYLASYFRRARMNALMPVSVIASTAVAAILGREALFESVDPAVMVGRTLVATLLGLAVIEHVFLAVPLPDALLWRWLIRSHAVAAAENP